MRQNVLIFFLIIFQINYSQVKPELYENNFQNNHSVEFVPLDQNKYLEYKKELRGKNELFHDYGRGVINGFKAVMVYESKNVNLYRVIEKCSDCNNYYYLFFKNNNGKIRLINEETPISTFKMLMKLFEKYNDGLSENELCILLRESYFLHNYNEYFSKPRAIP